jgi:hypothetical protein
VYLGCIQYDTEESYKGNVERHPDDSEVIALSGWLSIKVVKNRITLAD